MATVRSAVLQYYILRISCCPVVQPSAVQLSIILLLSSPIFSCRPVQYSAVLQSWFCIPIFCHPPVKNPDVLQFTILPLFQNKILITFFSIFCCLLSIIWCPIHNILLSSSPIVCWSPPIFWSPTIQYAAVQYSDAHQFNILLSSCPIFSCLSFQYSAVLLYNFLLPAQFSSTLQFNTLLTCSPLLSTILLSSGVVYSTFFIFLLSYSLVQYSSVFQSNTLRPLVTKSNVL